MAHKNKTASQYSDMQCFHAFKIFSSHLSGRMKFVILHLCYASMHTLKWWRFWYWKLLWNFPFHFIPCIKISNAKCMDWNILAACSLLKITGLKKLFFADNFIIYIVIFSWTKMAFFRVVIARNNLPKKISHQKVPKSLLTYGKVCTFPELA